MSKAEINKDTFLQLSKQILQAKDLLELKTIGSHLFDFSNSRLKTSLIKLYQERKREIITEMVHNSENKVFIAIYKIITRAMKYNMLVPAAELLYVLKNRTEIKLTDAELAALFDVYRQKKSKLLLENKRDKEINGVEDFEDDLI